MLDDYLQSLRASGRLESGGAFTVDLQRMAEKLARYQLHAPEHWILLALSAAVAGGARRFRLHQQWAQLRAEWDGQAYTVEELVQLLDNLDSSELRLRNLGRALNGLRQLGQSELRSGKARLTLEPSSLTIGPAEEVAATTLTVQRSGWRRLHGFRPLPERSLLAEHGRLAPLQLDPPLPPFDWPNCPWVVHFGPRPSFLQALHWASARPMEGVTGVVFPGSDPSWVVASGVSFPVSMPVQGVQMVLWHEVALDLSDRAVLQGRAWAELQREVMAQTVAALLESNPPRRTWAFLLRMSLDLEDGEGPSALDQPYFRNVHGEPRSFRQVRADYERHGLLATVGREGDGPDWEPERLIVVEHPHERFLLEMCPSHVDLSGAASLPRLPDWESYLARIPSPRGEIGLRKPCEGAYREWRDKSWHNEPLAPTVGVDFAGPSWSHEIHARIGQCLLALRGDEPDLHLHRLGWIFADGHLREETFDFEQNRLAMARATWLPGHFGARIPLLSLSPKALARYSSRDLRMDPDIPILSPTAIRLLQPFLPLQRVEAGDLHWTPVAMAGLFSIAPRNSFLLGDLFRPESAAGRLLGSHLQMRVSRPPGWLARVPWGDELGTLDLLLALLRTEGPAREALSRAGITPERLAAVWEAEMERERRLGL